VSEQEKVAITSGPEGSVAARPAGASSVAPAAAQEPAARRSDRSGPLDIWGCRHCQPSAGGGQSGRGFKPTWM